MLLPNCTEMYISPPAKIKKDMISNAMIPPDFKSSLKINGESLNLRRAIWN